jgi:uncharacterized membrane protein YqjE
MAAVPPAAGPEAAPSLQGLAAGLAGALGTRIELAVVELRQEGERRKDMLVLALAATLFFALALLCASLLVVVIFWDTHRVAALCGVAAVHAAVAVLAAARLHRLRRDSPAPFEATLAELARDREMLGGSRD